MATAIVRAVLRHAQGGKCCYCGAGMIRWKHKSGARIPPKAETLEHLRRKADGGGNARDNLALACRECNQGRGLTDWLTYKSYRMGELA